MLPIQQMDSFNSLCKTFLADHNGDASVSFYVLSKKSPKIKQLNLEKLTLDKLHKYEEQHRLVVVVATHGTFVAFMDANKAAQVGTDLTIDGKSVTVKQLSDEEYEQLKKISELINEAKEKAETDKKIAKPIVVESRPAAPRRRIQPGLASVQYESTFTQFIFKIAHISERIKSRILEAWNENLQQIKKIKQEEARQDLDKHFDIKRSEVKKQDLKHEVTAEQVKKNEIQRSS